MGFQSSCRGTSRSPRDADNPGLATAVLAMTTGDAPDTRRQETPHGSAILESLQVERADLGGLAKLPPFRPVAISLMRLFDRDDVNNNQIARLVESDPTLTAELLAVVNSPMFALRTTVTSPTTAIALLGVDTTRSLATTLAMRSLMQGAPRTPVVRRFWVHSMATATIAQHFARFFHADPNAVHVCALMHDLGRLGLLAAYPSEYAAMALTAHESTDAILAAEQAAFGMTHCRAGALLAKGWSLPEPLQQVAAYHHDNGSDHEDVALVQLCCRLADDLQFQSISRCDIQKPEETIATCAPAHVRNQLTSGLPTVSEAIIRALQTLDF